MSLSGFTDLEDFLAGYGATSDRWEALLRNPTRSKERDATKYQRVNMSGFRRLLRSQSIRGLAHPEEVSTIGRQLEDLIRRCRNPVSHGDEPMHPAKVADMRKLLFGSRSGDGLVWRINRLIREP